MKKYCILLLLLSGCSLLPTPKTEPVHLYLFETYPTIKNNRSAKTIAISTPTSQPGFDTPQIAYQRQALTLSYFLYHRWVDTPAHMLKPLLVQTLDPYFVILPQMASHSLADIQINTELVSLKQNFIDHPSHVDLQLRIQIIDVKNNHVISSRLFNEMQPAATEDAYGGVIATNLALHRILIEVLNYVLLTTGSHEVEREVVTDVFE